MEVRLERDAHPLAGLADEHPDAVRRQHAERVDEPDRVDVAVARDALEEVEVLDEPRAGRVDREERDGESELVRQARRLDRGVDRPLHRPPVRLLDEVVARRDLHHDALDAAVGRALHVVDRLQRVLGEHVDFRVGVAAAVRAAEALLLVERHQQRLERRRCLAGAGTPADQHRAELELGRLRKKRRGRHRGNLRRHADARPHLRDRLRDLRVVDVAVVRRVQRHPEAVRPPGLGQQFLGAFGVVCLDLEVRRRSEQEVRHELP